MKIVIVREQDGSILSVVPVNDDISVDQIRLACDDAGVKFDLFGADTIDGALAEIDYYVNGD